jgi:integrase
VALVENHVVPNVGSTQLQALTATSLNKLYAHLLAQGKRNGTGGLSPKTVRNVHVLIHKALEDAVRWSHLARNVAEYADPPKSRARSASGLHLHTWKADELVAFLNSVSDHRLYAAFLLAATTGMRRGEVLGLRWSDIDFDHNRVSVCRSLVSVNYQISISDPKTPRSRRAIAIDETTAQVLRAHKVKQAEDRLASEGDYQDQDLVFAGDDGAPIHPDSFTNAFDALVKKSGLPRIRLHDLRHTHATLALQAGIHPKVVSERLGHASVSITLDTYSHAVPSLQEQAAETVANLLFG